MAYCHRIELALVHYISPDMGDMEDRRTWTRSFEAVSVELGLAQVLSPHVKVVSDMLPLIGCKSNAS